MRGSYRGGVTLAQESTLKNGKGKGSRYYRVFDEKRVKREIPGVIR